MPKLNSMQDLQAHRAAVKASASAAVATNTTIYVGAGTCGIAAGAREVIQALEKELARQGLQARIVQVGCIGMCVKEPLVDVQQAGGDRITYGNVQPDMVSRIVESHLIKGQPVRDWIVGRLTVTR